ncbi:MAG: hypothetical protein LBT04_07165 [Prevotellaceae bacterium]|nr:hypothetical protein [Prevotellaceae bacterium]
MQELQPLLFCGSSRIQKFATECLQYLKDEGEKLGNVKAVLHASSYVIESIFGSYKNRKLPNSLNGVTRHIMILPLLTAINTETGKSNICFKSVLESVFLRDLNQWSCR